jgi:hypothetical protein
MHVFACIALIHEQISEWETLNKEEFLFIGDMPWHA